MQLNELLDIHTIRSISEKTNIAEDNIEALVASEFDKINRVKTMGFISIIEREYKADLSTLKAAAIEYYDGLKGDESVTFGAPPSVEKKGKSKWFVLIVFLLLLFALWYAFNNFDKEKLKEMLPFSEEKLSEMIMPTEEENATVKSVESHSENEPSMEVNTLKIETVIPSQDEKNSSY